MKKSMLATIGVCIICIASIGSEIWSLLIVGALWGFWGVFLALLLFPGTICLAPWYMLFAHGNWHLLAFTYGGGLLGGFLFGLGDDDSDKSTEDVKHPYNIEIGESESQKYSPAISDHGKETKGLTKYYEE